MSFEQALKIAMMSEDELRFLADLASQHTKIAEIGCARGGSTRAMAERTKGWVFAIDNWKGEGLAETVPDLYEQFWDNIKDLENIAILSMDSVVAAKQFPVPSFDMIFIDGAHDFASVKSDILAWLPLLESGGIMCGHDSACPDVKSAVRETLNIDSGLSGIWVWQKP